jgi:hypothetical protein
MSMNIHVPAEGYYKKRVVSTRLDIFKFMTFSSIPWTICHR